MSEVRALPRIRVLVVDDSPVVRELLVHLLGADPAILVVGTAVDGEDALESVRQDRKSTRLNSSHIQKSRMPSSA